MTLSLEWDGIAIAVSHNPNWLNTGYDHVEMRAGQRLPVTQTGYRSLFLYAEELAQFDGIEDFVRQWLETAATSRDWQKHVEESRQLSLF